MIISVSVPVSEYVSVSVSISVSVSVSMATSCVTLEHLRENPEVLERFFFFFDVPLVELM